MKLKTHQLRPIVLFDGVCNLCNGAVDFLIRRDRLGVIRFASLQSEVGNQIAKAFDVDASKLHSIILVLDGKVYQESTAILKLLRFLSGPWKLGQVFLIVPRVIRDFVYRWIARNRYQWFGKRETCRLPTPEEKERFLERAD